MKLLIVSATFCAVVALTTATATKARNGTVVRPLTGKQCPRGWIKQFKQCFLYVSHALSWVRAQRNCAQLKANLASVHSIMQYQFIQKLIFHATHANEEAWLGASDAQETGYWFWSDGTQFNYSDWCPGQPNNDYFTSERCLQINSSEKKCWDNKSCTNLLPSVCVKNIESFLGHSKP
ncbi:hypothetical protein ACER0C_001683 [Sarotherodon galilaeus]